MMRRDGWLTRLSALALGLGIAGQVAKADEPMRKREAVWPGMIRAGMVLLPNGWSLRPAGRQAKLGDFPVLIAEHPREPILAILHSGYGEHEVVTVQA